MTQATLHALKYLLAAAGGVFALYGVYFAVVALYGLKGNRADTTASLPSTRFAVVIAARNEAAVIGQLVDSLQNQHYPRELYDIIVAPNNCTDDTRAIAKAHGAKIFDPKGPIRSKGEVLNQVGDWLLQEGSYGALCVLDADNLVHPDFLLHMNTARLAGAEVAQGYRDSKNPADTAVSTCYSVCYWMLNRFYNAGRSALGLSCLVNGSGFMVTLQMLRKIGGWQTETMTEDYEFTAQCVLAGARVQYVPDAIIYDEQPLTFMQSWRQRRRWSSGSVQGMRLYLPALLRKGIHERDKASLDLAVTYATPLVQLFSPLLGLCSLSLLVYSSLALHTLPIMLLGMWGLLLAGAAFLACCCVACGMVWASRGSLAGTGKGIACFGLFLLSWTPIGIISLFRQQTTWHAIAHTRGLSLRDVA